MVRGNAAQAAALVAVAAVTMAGCSAPTPSARQAVTVWPTATTPTIGQSPPAPAAPQTTQARPAPVVAAPITADQMLDAPVPSLCDHPAGRLVGGTLPAVQHVEINEQDGAWRTEQFASWTAPDGSPVAALAFNCNHGGVGWPDRIVFYGPGPVVLAAVDVSDLTHGSREQIRRLRVDGDGVRVEVAGIREQGECEACASGDAVLRYRWTGTEARGSVVTRYSAAEAAKKAVAAGYRGDSAEMDRLFTGSARSQAQYLKVRPGESWVFQHCQPSTTAPGDYECVFDLQGGGRTSGAFPTLTKTGYATWQVTQLQFEGE